MAKFKQKRYYNINVQLSEASILEHLVPSWALIWETVESSEGGT